MAWETTILTLGFVMLFGSPELSKGVNLNSSENQTYLWEVSVDKFDLAPYLYSPPFYSWNGSVEEPWQLQFYPYGKSSVRSECLAIYLIHRKAHHVTVDFDIILFNQEDPEKTVSVYKNSTFDNSEDGWGPGPCIEDNILDDPPSGGIYEEGAGFVKDGKIKIGVRMPSSFVPIYKEQPMTITYIWDLNVDNLKVQNGNNLLSDKIKTVNNGKENIWQVQVYPNGVDSETEGMLSVFLVHRGSVSATIFFEITLLNETPEKSHTYIMEDTFTFDLQGWGERNVIEKRAINEGSGFIFDKKNIRIQVRLPTDSSSFNKLKYSQVSVPFLWEVPLSEMTAMNGEYMLSPKFITWKNSEWETWQLQLYPNGKSAQQNGTVSLYLIHRGPKKVDCSFELFLENEKEEETIFFALENVKFKYDSHGWGANVLVKRSVLDDPLGGFLFDGIVKLGVRLATEHFLLQKKDSLTVPYIWDVNMKDMNMAKGKYILSPNITTWQGVKQHIWQLQLFPKGTETGGKGQTSLFITHRGDDEIDVQWVLSIVNTDSALTESRSGKNKFGYDLQGWGSQNFISTSKLLNVNEGFVFDGKIRIGVELPTDNVTLSIDNDCPVIRESPPCEICPKPASSTEQIGIQLTNQQPIGNHPNSPINASLHNLYRELKLKTPDGSEFSINHIMSFESIEKVISNLMKLSGNSSNYSVRSFG